MAPRGFVSAARVLFLLFEFRIWLVQGAAPVFTPTNLPQTVNNVDADTIGLNSDVIYTVVATDADGDTLWYFLYDNQDQFSVNAATGDVTAIRNLHYLVSQTIPLDIGVWDANDRTDAGVVHGTLTLEIINGNHIPYILNWPKTATIPETSGRNTLTCDADVIDTDNDPLFYDINVDPSTDTGLFYMDSACKCIKLTGLYSLNYERLQQYTVTVKVRDPWSTSAAYTCTVMVTNANDVPTFSKAIYTVNIDEESTPTVDPAFITNDEDSDTFTYSFLNANHSDWFAINTINGQITVSNAIDRDTLGSNQIYLTVHATDVNGGIGSAQVLLNIADVNDNAPAFGSGTYTFITDQLAAPGANIGTVAASDIDTGLNAQISYSSPSSTAYFNVLANGDVTTAKTLTGLTYGSVTQIIVYAIDAGNPAKTGSATVDISFTEAATTTSSTTTSTEAGYFDKTENIVVFAILISLVGILFLIGLFFCMKKMITGHCCFSPEYDERDYTRRVRPQDDYGDYRYEYNRSPAADSSGGRTFPLQKEKF